MMCLRVLTITCVKMIKRDAGNVTVPEVVREKSKWSREGESGQVTVKVLVTVKLLVTVNVVRNFKTVKGQANPPSDLLTALAVVQHSATKVWEIFQDLNFVTTRMDRLYRFIQQASKHLHLGSGSEYLESPLLRLLVQSRESHHQNLQRLSQDYCIIAKLRSVVMVLSSKLVIRNRF